MPSKEDKAAEAKKQQTNTKYRTQLNNAFAALEGQRSIDSFNAYTFEEALDDLIEQIEGDSTKIRPNKLDEVSRVEDEVAKVVASVKELPPEDFLDPDTSRDVNTE